MVERARNFTRPQAKTSFACINSEQYQRHLVLRLRWQKPAFLPDLK